MWLNLWDLGKFYLDSVAIDLRAKRRRDSSTAKATPHAPLPLPLLELPCRDSLLDADPNVPSTYAGNRPLGSWEVFFETDTINFDFNA
jgi:hypothetical protein